MSKYEGVHSCGPNCTQPLCVANRRIEELTADRDDIRRKYIAEAKETDRLQAKVEELEAKVAELTKPVPPAEEGEFTSCAEMLDDWFGSCNIQGTAQMETVEVEELVEEMRLIERRKNQICVHGKGLTDYCEPCGRIHGG